MRWTLRFGEDQTLELPEGSTILGRSDTCDVTLPADASVSRRHARVSVTRGKVTIEDLGSRNGTFVNERRVVGPTRLSPGDRIHCGDLEIWVECTRSPGASGDPATSIPTLERQPRRPSRQIMFLVLATAVLVPVGLLLPHLRARPRGAVSTPDPIEKREPTPTASTTSDAVGTSVVSGLQLFARHCANCHGTSGKGGSAPKLAGTSHPHDMDEITVMIQEGAPPEMPGFGKQLTTEQVQAVAEYVHSLMGKGKANDHHH